MTIVTAMEKLCQWTKENIAEQILLKKPDDDQNTKNYPFTLVHPSVFTMLMPPSDKMPTPEHHQVPSITVQLLEGSENRHEQTGSLSVRFRIITWSPGIHGKELLKPKEKDGRTVQKPWGGDKASEHYQRKTEGWVDTWNVVDRLMEELRETPFIGGLHLNPDEGIHFGQETENDQVISFFPYWVAWVTCSLRYGAEKSGRNFEKLLE